MLGLIDSKQSTPAQLWDAIITMDADMIITFAVLIVALIIVYRLKKQKKI